MKVAAAQLRPHWLDPAATTSQVVTALGKAARAGAEVVAFPETFLGGYPFWISPGDGARFNDAAQKAAYARYLDAAVTAGGAELRTIREAAGDLGLFVVLGFAERGEAAGRGTVFCSIAPIDPERGILPVHRKLRPTFEERLAWGEGDGHGLRVHEFRGVRISFLNCWENWMPLARQALWAQGPDLHISVWPGARRLTEECGRFIAREGRVHHLLAGALLDGDLLPADFPVREGVPKELGYDGGSALAGPDGAWIHAPQVGTEGLVVGKIDLAHSRAERQLFDPAGHYARPDVLHLEVDRRPRRDGARFRDED